MCFDCIEAADLIKYMDESVDPCDDFYQFACREFMKPTVIPDHRTEITALDSQNNKLQEQVRIVVEEQPVANEAKHFALVRNLYASCMNKCKTGIITISQNEHIKYTMNTSFLIPKGWWKYNWLVPIRND